MVEMAAETISHIFPALSDRTGREHPGLMKKSPDCLFFDSSYDRIVTLSMHLVHSCIAALPVVHLQQLTIFRVIRARLPDQEKNTRHPNGIHN
jgi:hypothetical protein